MMGQIERSFSYYSLMVPTYIVNLDLPPEKRWQQVAASKSKQVNNTHLLINGPTTQEEFSHDKDDYWYSVRANGIYCHSQLSCLLQDFLGVENPNGYTELTFETLGLE